MNIFNSIQYQFHNLLPHNGTAFYFGKIFSQEEADNYLEILLNTIPWQQDELILFGKKIITKRKVAWYGDEPFQYTYSNSTKSALPWTDTLLELKTVTERLTGETYNSCLLNLYHNGQEGMGWHSDDEPELKKNGAITSMSFGADRKFVFKHKQSKEKVEVVLAHGSILVMKDEVQTYWLHALPVSKRVLGSRVNLTFRTIA